MKNATISIISVGTVNPMTLGNNLTAVVCIRLGVNDKLYWNSTWASITGAPTASADVVVEYLGA